MSNAHVTNISSLKQLQEEEPNFNTVDWDNLNRMKYMRGRMVPDCWHMGRGDSVISNNTLYVPKGILEDWWRINKINIQESYKITKKYNNIN